MQEEDLSRALPEPEAPEPTAEGEQADAAGKERAGDALCHAGDYPVKVAAVRKAVERRAAFGC